MSHSNKIKAIGVLLIVLTLLVMGISLFIHADYFRNTIKSILEKTVSSATGQSFTIGKIDGDLIRELKLKDVSLKIEGQPFVHLEEASVKYSIPLMLDSSMLFSRVIPLNNVSIRGLSASFIRDENGNWNVEKLTRKSKNVLKEKIKKSLGWNVFIEKSLLKDAKITVEDGKKKEISNIEIREMDFSLRMFGITDKIDFNLKRGDLYVSPYQLNINGLSTNVIYTEDKTQIRNLESNINGTKIKFDGEVSDFTERKFKFNAAAYGFEMKKGVLNVEVQDVLGQYKSPEDIRTEMKIKILDSLIMGKKFRGSLEKVKMAGTRVEVQNGEVKTDFGETSFSGNAKLDQILRKQGGNEFDFKVSLKNINLSDIPDLVKKQPALGILNANLGIEGKWKYLEDLEVKVNIKEYQQRGRLGEIDLKGLVDARKSDVKFDLISNLRKINLSSILKDKKYTSNLNSNLHLNVFVPIRGNSATLTTAVNGEILPSSIFDINLAGGEINVLYTPKALGIKSLSLISDSFSVKVTGEENKMDFSYKAEAKNLNLISKFFPELDLKGSFYATGKVQGEIKNPRVNFSAKVSDFVYKDFKAKSINIGGDTLVNLENPQLQINGNLKQIQFQKRNIQSVDLRAVSEGRGVKGNFSILEDSQRTYEIQLKLGDLKSRDKNIELEKIRLNLKDKVLQNRDAITLTIFPDKFIAKSLNLYYKDSLLLGDADVNFNGIVNAILELKSINLADISQALELEPPILGVASGNIKFQGTVEKPTIKANLSAANLGFMEFKSDKLSMNLSYLDKNLSLDLSAFNGAQEILFVKGGANIDLNFKNAQENIKDAIFDVTVKSSGVNLSPFAKLNKEIREINGEVVVDLRAYGSVKSPKVSGQMKLQNVSLKIHSLRDEIRITTGHIEMDGEKGIIKALEVQTGEGKGTFEGDIDVGKLSYNISGKMENLQIKPKGVTANLDGVLAITGSSEKIYINGNLKVRKANIKIPELPTKQVEGLKFVDEEQEKKEEFTIEETKETDYFRDSVGMALNVSIPGGALVKGKGANIEIKGEVRVAKKYGEPIIITGSIDTARGTYEFLGKLFKIEEGKVSFPGTVEINPFLNVRALYKVSNVNIFVNVTGRLEQPIVKLSSDPPMEQTDIFSYLAFGTSSDKISTGQRASLQTKAAEVVGLMAAGKVKDIVGEKFQLDVVSIAGGEKGFQDAQIEVGKYLTDNLYVAYERGYTNTLLASTSPTITNRVRVEYRLFDFLSLESDIGGEDAGGDIFFNYNY
jgi:translocation and assembly module TamB